MPRVSITGSSRSCMLGFGVVPAHRLKVVDVSDADLPAIQSAADKGLIASFELLDVTSAAPAADSGADAVEEPKTERKKKSKKKG